MSAVRQRARRRAPSPCARVVLDVRDPFIARGDELEDEGLAAASVCGDPVDAEDERLLAGVDEFPRSRSFVAWPSGRPLLLLEDRPGPVRPVSVWCPPPPWEASFDAPPDGAGTEQPGQRRRIALVQRCRPSSSPFWGSAPVATAVQRRWFALRAAGGNSHGRGRGGGFDEAKHAAGHRVWAARLPAGDRGIQRAGRARQLREGNALPLL